MPSDQDATQQAIGRLSDRITAGKQDTAEQLDALGERLEKHLDRIEAKLSRKVDQLDADTQREFQEARRDLGELRDRLGKVEGATADAAAAANRAEEKAEIAANASRAGTVAAVGAARNATETTQASVTAQFQRFWKTTTGRIVKWAAAIAAFAAGIGSIDDAVRWWDGLWAYLGRGPTP